MKVKTSLSHFVNGLGLAVARLIFIFYYLFRISVPMASLTLLTLIPYFLQGIFSGKFIRPYSKKARKASHSVQSLAEESISNMRTVKAFANEQNELDKFCKKSVVKFDREMKLINTHILNGFMFEFIRFFQFFTVFVSAGYYMKNG